MENSKQSFLARFNYRASQGITKDSLIGNINNRISLLVGQELSIEFSQMRFYQKSNDLSDEVSGSMEILLRRDLESIALVSAVIESITEIDLTKINFKLLAIENIDQLVENVFSRAKDIAQQYGSAVNEISDNVKSLSRKDTQIEMPQRDVISPVDDARLSAGVTASARAATSHLARYMMSLTGLRTKTNLSQMRKSFRLVDTNNYKLAFALAMALLVVIPFSIIQGQKNLDSITVPLFFILVVGTVLGFVQIRNKDAQLSNA